MKALTIAVIFLALILIVTHGKNARAEAKSAGHYVLQLNAQSIDNTCKMDATKNMNKLLSKLGSGAQVHLDISKNGIAGDRVYCPSASELAAESNIPF